MSLQRTQPKEIPWEDADRVRLARGRDQTWALVNTTMNLLVPQNTGNLLKAWATARTSTH